MPAVEMAELINKNTGERLLRKVAEKGANAVYVDLGLMGATKPQGFFIKNGKPTPSCQFKHLRLTTTYMDIK